jgi:hypothetical protein
MPRSNTLPPDTYKEAMAVALAADAAEDEAAWRIEEAEMVASLPVPMTVQSWRLAESLAIAVHENGVLNAFNTDDYAGLVDEVTRLQETCRRLKRWAKSQASHGKATPASL